MHAGSVNGVAFAKLTASTEAEFWFQGTPCIAALNDTFGPTQTPTLEGRLGPLRVDLSTIKRLALRLGSR